MEPGLVGKGEVLYESSRPSQLKRKRDSRFAFPGYAFSVSDFPGKHAFSVPFPAALSGLN